MPKKGQSVKFDAIKREAYLELLREGGRRGASAVAVGITRQMVAVYAKENPEFADEVSKAEMEANELVEDALFQAARSGNTTAMQVWLYNRNPDRWADRRKHEFTGKDGAPLGPLVIIRGAKKEGADERDADADS